MKIVVEHGGTNPTQYDGNIGSDLPNLKDDVLCGRPRHRRRSNANNQSAVSKVLMIWRYGIRSIGNQIGDDGIMTCCLCNGLKQEHSVGRAFANRIHCDGLRCSPNIIHYRRGYIVEPKTDRSKTVRVARRSKSGEFCPSLGWVMTTPCAKSPSKSWQSPETARLNHGRT